MKLIKTPELVALKEELKKLNPNSLGYRSHVNNVIRRQFPDKEWEQELSMVDEIVEASNGLPVQEYFIELAMRLKNS